MPAMQLPQTLTSDDLKSDTLMSLLAGCELVHQGEKMRTFVDNGALYVKGGWCNQPLSLAIAASAIWHVPDAIASLFESVARPAPEKARASVSDKTTKPAATNPVSTTVDRDAAKISMNAAVAMVRKNLTDSGTKNVPPALQSLMKDETMQNDQPTDAETAKAARIAELKAITTGTNPNAKQDVPAERVERVAELQAIASEAKPKGEGQAKHQAKIPPGQEARAAELRALGKAASR